jgi:hypothetical protein
MNEPKQEQPDTPAKKDNAGLVIAAVCLGLLALLVFINMRW